MKLFDLTSIASSIDEPFRIVNFASLGAVEVGVVICEGPKSWHRSLERRELALVLEGVITVDRPTGRNVVNEGAIVSLPPEVGLKITSGMRSTVVVFRPRTPTGETNGHQAPIDHDDKAVEQVNFAVDALSCDSNAWRSVGAVSGYTTSTTRLNGVGDPFAVPDGGFLLLVYRGVVDFEVDGGHAAGGPGAEADSSESVDAERGAVVGSQSLVVPQGHSLSLNAPRGATVVGLARAAAVLPIVAPQTSADDDPDGRPGDGGGTGPAV